MIIALIGAHGTGKTSVFNALKTKRPNFLYFSEGTRHQTTVFGYANPYQIVDEVGIGTFEAMNINSWSVIDRKVNTVLDAKKTIITDRSAIDNYGYYLTLKKGRKDVLLGTFIKKMAKHYVSLIDIFIYFPVGVFVLKNDKMRLGDEAYQKKLDKNMRKALSELGIPKAKIHELKSVKIKDRVDEILNLII